MFRMFVLIIFSTSLHQIMSYLQNLERQATTADVTVTSIGRSYENRDVPLVEVKSSKKAGTIIIIMDISMAHDP